MLESKFLEQLIAEKKAEITKNPNDKDLNLIRALAFELKHQYGQAENIYRHYPHDELACERSKVLLETFGPAIYFARMGLAGAYPQDSAQHHLDPRLATSSAITQQADPLPKLYSQASQPSAQSRNGMSTNNLSRSKKVRIVDNKAPSSSLHSQDLSNGAQPNARPSQSSVEKKKVKSTVLSEETHNKFKVGQRSILN